MMTMITMMTTTMMILGTGCFNLRATLGISACTSIVIAAVSNISVFEDEISKL